MYNTFYSVRSHQRMQYSSGAINVHVLYMYTLYMYINVHYIIIHKREKTLIRNAHKNCELKTLSCLGRDLNQKGARMGAPIQLPVRTGVCIE